MQLLVGGREFALRTRALVVGTLARPALASESTAAGADLLALCTPPAAEPVAVAAAVAELVGVASVPVGCVTASGAVAEAAIAAGASLVCYPSGFADPALLAALAGGDVVVAAGAGDAPEQVRATLQRAVAAGIDKARVVAAVTAAPGVAWRSVTSSGVPVVAVMPERLALGQTVGLAVAAIAGGCRLLMGSQVQLLRRCADTCADLLEAR